MAARPERLFTRSDWTGDRTLDCDVVVIGSGAGGAVTAAELAEAGLDVILLEEGGYNPTDTFTPSALRAARTLYRDGGGTFSIGNPAIAYQEGCTVGGSTAINGGMSWRTPERILERWHREDGLDDILPIDMEARFMRVEGRISARHQDPSTIGRDNQLLKEGADKKGWEVIDNIRNQVHCVGSNVCAFGCPTGAKQSTLVSYVPRALAFGARLYADARVDKLIVERGHVRGVKGHVKREDGGPSYTFDVRARAVVSSAGAMHTPALLLRSDIRSPSGRLGHNLSMHPNVKVIAQFDDPIEGWKGVHQAYQVREFQEEGFLFAAVNLPPSVLAMGTPMYGAAMADLLENYNNILTAGMLLEDSVVGRVRLGPGGQPLAFYQMSDFDALRLVRGTALLCELLFVAGARRIVLPFEGVADLHGPDDVRRLFARKIPKSAMEVVTVHMMGTAAMGGDPNRHVCDMYGKVRGYEGLWVADASLFPSPIGVNPMETIMALATRNAERMLETGVGQKQA